MQFKLTEQNNKNKGKIGERERTLRQRHPQNHKTNNKPNEPAQKKNSQKKENICLLYFPTFRRRTKPTKAKQKYFCSEKEKRCKRKFLCKCNMRVH